MRYYSVVFEIFGIFREFSTLVVDGCVKGTDIAVLTSVNMGDKTNLEGL